MLRKISPVAGSRFSILGKKVFPCVWSAILLILSFPGFNLEYLGWFGFVPLFFAAHGKGKARSFLLFYLTGLFFWWGIIYWLVNVTFIGTFVLVLYLALYFGVFGLFFHSYCALRTNYCVLLLPCAWVILEYIRSHLFTGFPWALLGYSQYLNLPVIQMADVTGAWGVSFVVMLVNATIHSILGKKQRYLVPVFIVMITLIYGYSKLYLTPKTEDRAPVKVAVVQANIPQELKWEPSAREFIMAKYTRMTREASGNNPDLIIWPEAALPVVLEEEARYFQLVQALAGNIKVPILLGAVTRQQDNYYNSALLLSTKGDPVYNYRKIHLVPFGEYIPLRRQLPFLETVAPIGDITPGKEYTIFELEYAGKDRAVSQGARFGVLICFEDLFPGLSRKFVQNGAHFLINITNDAWYKKTPAAEQHLSASVFRAVENGVGLARCANTGVSGFVSARGIIDTVKDSLGRKIFVEGFSVQTIDISKTGRTFYTRYGDVFVVVCFLITAWTMVFRCLKN